MTDDDQAARLKRLGFDAAYADRIAGRARARREGKDILPTQVVDAVVEHLDRTIAADQPVGTFIAAYDNLAGIDLHTLTIRKATMPTTVRIPVDGPNLDALHQQATNVALDIALPGDTIDIRLDTVTWVPADKDLTNIDPDTFTGRLEGHANVRLTHHDDTQPHPPPTPPADRRQIEALKLLIDVGDRVVAVALMDPDLVTELKAAVRRGKKALEQ